MSPADVSAFCYGEPPYINHGHVVSTLILILVKCLRDVTVAVVAEDIMIHFLIDFVSFRNRLIILDGISNIKGNVLMCLPKSQVIYGDSVGARKIMDNSIGHCNACVTDKRKEPRD